MIKIADNELIIGEEQMPWEEISQRGSDRIRFQAAVLKFQDKVFENAAVRVSETTIDVNGTSFELAQVGPIEATTNLVIIPREAMGLGDAKLLAGIGAFLGLWAVAFVVFASSMAGGVVSLVLILARRKDWRSRIPYGPYIALGAVIWIFYGREPCRLVHGFDKRIAGATLRYFTAGESHGQCLIGVIEGLPAGLKIDLDAVNRDLARRQKGYGRGGRMKIEADQAEILSGVRRNETIGSPIALMVKNKDFKINELPPVTKPRPRQRSSARRSWRSNWPRRFSTSLAATASASSNATSKAIAKPANGSRGKWGIGVME